MSMIASQITSALIVYSNICSGVVQRKSSKLWITGLCEGNSQVTGEFPAQSASNAENVIVVCLSTSWGINNKSEVEFHLAVFNDKRSSKSATSLSHSHSLTNCYTGYMHDDQ